MTEQWTVMRNAMHGGGAIGSYPLPRALDVARMSRNPRHLACDCVYLVDGDGMKWSVKAAERWLRLHEPSAEKLSATDDADKSWDVAGRILREACCSHNMCAHAFADWRLSVKRILDEEYISDENAQTT